MHIKSFGISGVFLSYSRLVKSNERKSSQMRAEKA
jgi:hypothetical protein